MALVGRLFILLAALFALPAGAQELPARPAGPIYDGAQILDPGAEAALDAKLRAWTQSSGRPIVVATVPTLGDMTVEAYAADLYRAWGIGPEDTDQGVLLLVASEERRVRIEVGYGLTPFITDILSGRIVREAITPRFKQGDYAGGIDAGVDALIAQLRRAPEDARAIAQAAEAAEAQGRGSRRGGGGSAVSTIVWLGIMLGLIFLFSRGGGGGGGGGGRRHRRGGSVARDVLLWSAIGAMGGRHGGGGRGGFGGGGGGFGGGGGGFGGFGGGMSGGGGASGSW